MMEKKIGHRIVIEVNGFYDAKDWIYRLIRESVVKCGQCDAPATHVFWQDRAEWYCRCDAHREYGDMWTGSTRWNPSVISLNVLKEPALHWWNHAPKDQRRKTSIRSFDATDYDALKQGEYPYNRSEHYFVGSESAYGWRVYAYIYPLQNSEYAYELHSDHMHEHGGHMNAFGLRGAWLTEELAVEAAKAEATKRRLLSERES